MSFSGKCVHSSRKTQTTDLFFYKHIWGVKYTVSEVMDSNPAWGKPEVLHLSTPQQGVLEQLELSFK